MFILRFKTIYRSGIFIILTISALLILDFLGLGEVLLQEDELYLGIGILLLLIITYPLEKMLTKLFTNLYKIVTSK